MKKIKTGILLLTALVAVQITMAQTIEDGRSFLYYEKYISAKNVFQKLVDANPNNVEAVYWLGQTMLAMEDMDLAGAKAVYQKTLSANSNSALLIAGMGHVALLEGNMADARSRFETAISLSGGKNVAVLNAVGSANGDFNAKFGDGAYAVEKLKQAVDGKGGKDPDVYCNLGDAYRKLADGGNAQLAYEAALALKPNYARAKYRIGRIYQTQGFTQEEIYLRYYNEAMAMDPNYTPVYFTLYQYFYETNVGKSATYLDKYLNAKGTDEPNACFLKAQITFAQGLYQQTITKANECIASGGANPYPNLYGLIAYSYNSLGDSANAKTSFDLYFQKQKPNKIGPKDYNTYAKILLKFPGNEALAGTYVDKAVELDSTEAGKVTLLKSVAAGYEAQKQYKNAADWYRKVLNVRKSPSKVDLYNAGYNYNKGGDYLSSIDIFNTYVQKYPDESFGYYMNAKNEVKLDSTDAANKGLTNYLKIVSLTDQIKDKPGEKDRIKNSLRYLIEFYANVKRNKDSALYYSDRGVSLDPADSDFVSMRKQIGSMSFKALPPPVKSTTTVNAKGDRVTVAPDGTVTTVSKDGTTTIVTKDGKVTTIKAGVTVTTTKDGKVTTVGKDGKVTTTSSPPKNNTPKKK